MKVKTLSALAGFGGAMILSGTSQAALTGLVVTTVASGGGPAPAGAARVIYQVFAQFDNPGDRVLTWGIGGTQFGAGNIENRNADDSAFGSGFTNIQPAQGAAPYSAGTARDWDSYATLGVRYGNQVPAGADQPGYSPGFPSFITGTSVTVPAAGMAVFIAPEPFNTIGRADFINEGADTSTRTLLMQLVVNAGENVRGTIGLVWDGAAAPSGTVAGGLVFNSVIPAPGALALLGLAGLVGSRRRRG